jgi:hypothetical protein
MWNGGQLPWGKPYFADVKQTLLQNDPGYQQAREWWRSQQAQAGQTAAQLESTAAENERLRSELEQERQQYSKLYDEYGRAFHYIDGLERVRSVPRGEVDTDPEAGAEPPRTKRAQFASASGPVPDAGGPSGDVRGPERPAEPADAGGGEGADSVDEA